MTVSNKDFEMGDRLIIKGDENSLAIVTNVEEDCIYVVYLNGKLLNLAMDSAASSICRFEDHGKEDCWELVKNLDGDIDY